MPAFVFPGQGSQHQAMGRAWTDHPSWELVADASEAVDRDLAHLLLHATDDELTETRNAQLATFTMSLVVLDAVERLGIEPTACAGHSLGEYSALVASGTLGFEDGMRIVAERGEAMQAAADARSGVMAVLTGCDAETVDVACHLAEGDVWLANFNSAEETVIAGDPEAVAMACEKAIELGALATKPVAAGGAFHTPLMWPARSRLRKALADATFHTPEVPVVANVDALAHADSGPAAARRWQLLLSAQLCSPVRWRQSVLRLGGLSDHNGDGERLFVEIGPGNSLARLVRQTLPAARAVSVSSPDDLDRLVDALAGDTALHAFASEHQGEHLYVRERLVISPCAGVFQPVNDLADHGVAELTTEMVVEVGSLVGSVSGQEVRSPFAGRLMGMLSRPGERVQTGQPIAWLQEG